MRRGVQVGAVVVLGLLAVTVAGVSAASGSPAGGLLVVVAVVAVLAAVGAWWWQRRRQEELVAWAHASGWSFTPRDPGLGLATLHAGTPFGQGSGRTASEVLVGVYEGRTAVSFTYAWSTGSGDERRQHRAHVVGVALPAYLPTLELTPEGLGARVAKAFGARDLHVESAAFNAAYRVDTSDPRTAHAILHPRLLERLLRSDAVGLPWRIEGTWLLSWEQGVTDTSRIAPRLGVLAAVVRGVPRHVWQDHGHDPLASGPATG